MRSTRSIGIIGMLGVFGWAAMHIGNSIARHGWRCTT
jgi:hypothetical protein